MNLTDEQKCSLWDSEGQPYRDLRIISARAGTGKTRTLSAYVAELLDTWHENYAPWQGIALLSYTNVAKQELEEKIHGSGYGLVIASHPHFTGTIDAFVNQFIFLPHGASRMGATKRPKLVGEPYQAWEPGAQRQHERYFSSLSYRLDATIDFNAGSLAREYGRRKEDVERSQTRIESTKRSLNRRRYATQADSNYFASKVLADMPRLARALAKRFPVVIVDEAQDMTEAQHVILDTLVRAGLTHAVLIGDERQAIYEWNTARPQLYREKMAGGLWLPATISGSFRCSPNICKSLNSHSGEQSLAPSAGAKNGGYLEPVAVKHFDANMTGAGDCLTAIINEMVQTLVAGKPHASGEDYFKVAILARGKDEVAHLKALYFEKSACRRPSTSFADKRTRLFLALVHHAAHNNVGKAFAAYERLLSSCGDYDDRELMRTTLTLEWFGEAGNPLAYRLKVLQTIKQICLCFTSIPIESISIFDCSAVCEIDLPGIGAALYAIKADIAQYAPGKKGQINLPLSILFNTSDPKLAEYHKEQRNVQLVFSTVHGVKGETYDGVVFVIRKRGTSCGCGSSSNANLRIAEHNILECEGKRLQYVAASRAAQCLCIAAENDVDRWKEIFRA